MRKIDFWIIMNEMNCTFEFYRFQTNKKKWMEQKRRAIQIDNLNSESVGFVLISFD